jgi:hypothetical protein
VVPCGGAVQVVYKTQIERLQLGVNVDAQKEAMGLDVVAGKSGMCGSGDAHAGVKGHKALPTVPHNKCCVVM